MNVSLSAELESFVNDRVKSGSYHSPSELIADALRLFKEREAMRTSRIEELRKEIAVGIEQLDRGEYVDGEVAMERLRQNIRACKGKQT